MHSVTRVLTEHYEACLAAHGSTPQGMDWGADETRLNARFDTICRAIGLDEDDRSISLLDVGCGCGLFLDYLSLRYHDRVDYIGVDASSLMIDAARDRHPSSRWLTMDITEPVNLPTCDWVVANGLLTERRSVDESDMLAFAWIAIYNMFQLCRVGIVFNVLSSHVNYRQPTLFYWDPGQMMSDVAIKLSRHITILHDLPSYDYFCCVRREPWSRRADA